MIFFWASSVLPVTAEDCTWPSSQRVRASKHARRRSRRRTCASRFTNREVDETVFAILLAARDTCIVNKTPNIRAARGERTSLGGHTHTAQVLEGGAGHADRLMSHE